MSIRKIKTTISTIRGVYDKNGNYLPSGNYYFEIKIMMILGLPVNWPILVNFVFHLKNSLK